MSTGNASLHGNFPLYSIRFSSGPSRGRRILENLGRSPASVPELARGLDLAPNIVFDHIKELARRDRVEIAGYDDRDALYRRK